MNQQTWIQSLRAANPGWTEWRELIEFAQSLEMVEFENEYLGAFLTSGSTEQDAGDTWPGCLTVKVLPMETQFPAWLPKYVRPLVGLKASEYCMEGGYANAFDGRPSQPGHAFFGPILDAELGHPLIPIPTDCFPFQRNSSGALFHITKKLEILTPDASQGKFLLLDDLETFTKKSIRCVLEGRDWYESYWDRKFDIID